ncbi:hypothetical protein BHE74_00048827 [Ensete ventricosum]|nr:hypothetical protein BHE74_00048827 [Ensete ventricosum]
MLRPSVTQEWVEEYELPRERTKNRRWRRPYDMLAEATRGKVVVQVHHTRICMIRAAGELDCFSAHIRLRESGKSEDKADDDESIGARLPKSKASARKGVDSEESHSAAEADLLITKEGMSTMVPQRRDFRGVIDPLLSW